MSRHAAERSGRRGEMLAAWFLRLKGWRIVARRLRTARGEIDLVARRGRVVAFVEVKWRRREADLASALDHYRLQRVVACAEAVAARFVRPGDTMRIDAILLAPGRWPRHIANASLA